MRFLYVPSLGKIFGLFLAGLLAGGAAQAEGFGEPFYLVDGTFALDPVAKGADGTFRIDTFLPHHTLVFPNKRVPSREIGGVLYQPIVTQHGVRLLVPQKLISTKSFPIQYGRSTIIFHEDKFMCSEEDYDCKSVTGQDVIKGDVFRINKLPGLVELTGTDSSGNTLEGYLTLSRFQLWKAEGVLSDASEHYPRYLVDSTVNLTSLATSCSQKRETVTVKSLKADLQASVEPGEWFSVLKWLSPIVKLDMKGETSAVVEKTGSVKVEYGEAGLAYQFTEVELTSFAPGETENAPASHRTFLVTAQMQCAGLAPTALPVVVKQIVIQEGDAVIAHRNFSDFYPWFKMDGSLDVNAPAFEVYKRNGNIPYLSSITSRQSYSRVNRVWEEELGDASLAAIFTATFNASCPRKVVAGKYVIEECDRFLEPQNQDK